MNNSLIAIDTEYNSNQEILSLGVFNDNIQEEYFFRNNIDKRSFQIHKIPYDFLKNFQKYKIENINFIKNYNFILGFDLYTDLKVLKFEKIEKMYFNENIIDLKIILNSLGFNISLNKATSLIGFSGMNHNSLIDAKNTYNIYLYLYNLIKEDYSFYEFNELCSKITKASILGPEWEKEDYVYNLNKLKEKIKFSKNKINNNNKTLKKDIILNNNLIYVYIDSILEFRFPFEYLSKDINYILNNNLKESSFGIKFDISLLSKDIILYNK